MADQTSNSGLGQVGGWTVLTAASLAALASVGWVAFGAGPEESASSLLVWTATRVLPSLFVVCVGTAVTTVAAGIVLPQHAPVRGQWIPLKVVCGAALAWIALTLSAAFGLANDSNPRAGDEATRSLTVIVEGQARVEMDGGRRCHSSGQVASCSFRLPRTSRPLRVQAEAWAKESLPGDFTFEVDGHVRTTCDDEARCWVDVPGYATVLAVRYVPSAPPPLLEAGTDPDAEAPALDGGAGR